MEWAGYVSFLKKDFEEYALKKKMKVEIEIVKPDITDENQLFGTIRETKKKVDICTPSCSFYRARREKLMKLLSPLDTSEVANYSKIPATLRNSKLFRDDEGRVYGIVFLAGPYGLAYNADKVRKVPDSWDILWSDESAGKYSVNEETAFVNGYISIWVERPEYPTVVYDIDDLSKTNGTNLQKRLDRLASGASHFWNGFGNTPEQLKNCVTRQRGDSESRRQTRRVRIGN